MQEITEEQIYDWLNKNYYLSEFKITKKEQISIISNLQKLYKAATGSEINLGHFLTAIYENNFHKAINNADKLNLRCIKVYARFCYNILPFNWFKRVKESKL